jgi:hypothetical protein
VSGSFTDTTDRALLNWITGTSLGGFTPPTTTYIMLLTADPSLTAAIPTDPQLSELPELVATGYARKAVTWSSATTLVPPGGLSQIKNNNLVTFGPFTGVSGSGSATTFGALVNVVSGTAGEVFAVWQWNLPIIAPQNQAITIPIGNLVMTQQ